jgi:branched-chain amino acid transport system ATP-binding protein
MAQIASSLLSVTGLSKSFGALRVTRDVSIGVERNEVHAIIGPNGAGKTTLVNQLSGELQPDAGSILLDGEDISSAPAFRRALKGLARSYQITSIFPEFTVLENVVLAGRAHAGHSFHFLRPLLCDEPMVAAAVDVLESSGLHGRLHDSAARLGHGERRQLELAMTLAGRPKLLLLDEPMAGMSRKESREMTALLQQLKTRYAMLLVEHDMETVFALADRISVLVYGSILATGAPDEIRANPQVVAAYLGQDLAS